MEAPRPRARRRNAGFTLVELMVVVAIMMVVAAMVAPSLITVQADARQGQAAVDLVRFVRGIRATVMRTRTAHLLRFRETEEGNLGTIEAYGGMNNRCLLTNWNQAFTTHTPVAIFNMRDFSPDAASTTATGRHIVTLRARHDVLGVATPVAWLNLCYQPDGRTYMQSAAIAGFPPQGVDVLMSLDRSVVGHGSRGVSRQVLFQPGGPARLR